MPGKYLESMLSCWKVSGHLTEVRAFYAVKPLIVFLVFSIPAWSLVVIDEKLDKFLIDVGYLTKVWNDSHNKFLQELFCRAVDLV